MGQIFDFGEAAGGNFFGEKSVKDWTREDFRRAFEYMYSFYGADTAWEMLYRVIQLRAGEIKDLQFASFYELSDSGDSEGDMDGGEGEDFLPLIEDINEEDFEEDEEEEDFEDEEDEDFGDYGHPNRFF